MTTLAAFDILFRADMTGFSRAMLQGSAHVNRFTSRIGGLTTTLLQARIVYASFTKVVEGVTDSIFGMNARVETAVMQFATLTGSVDEAKKHVQELLQFSAKSPLTFEDVLKGARYLRLFGGAALDTSKYLQLVADAAAGTSAPFARVAFQVGRVYAAIQGGQPFGRALLYLQQMGVITPRVATQLEAMAKKGASASDMWQLFTKDMERFTDASIRQQHTWVGIISTLTDFMQIDISRATEPLFQFVKRAALALFQILESPAANKFIDDFAAGLTKVLAIVELIGQGIGKILPGLIQGFSNLGDIIIGALTTAWNTISTFSAQLYSGGVKTIQAYAQGILDGAMVYVRAAINWITSFISGFLIGASPPPYGPLSKIFQGGKATIEAWVQGAMTADLTGVTEDLPNIISKSWETVKGAGQALKAFILTITDSIKGLDRTIAGLEASAKKITDAFDAQRAPVQATMDEVDHSIKVIDNDMAHLQNSIDKTTQAFEDQITPLQAQIDHLKDTLTLSDKMRDNGLALKKNQLEIAYAQAFGNKAAQAAIQKQLDQINNQITLANLGEEQNQLLGERAALPLEEQVKNLKQQEEDALKPLKDRLQLLKDQKLTLQDTKLTLQETLDKLDEQEKALLKPINDQLKTYKDQRAELIKQRDIWKQILSHVTQVQSTLEKPKKGDITKPLTDVLGGVDRVDPTKTNAATKAAEKIAEAAHRAALKAAKAFVNTFVTWLRNNLPTAMYAVAGFLEGGPVGAAIGAAFGLVLQNTLFKNIKFNMNDAAGQLGSAIMAVLGFIALGPIGVVIGIAFGNLIGQLFGKGLAEVGKPGGAAKIGVAARGLADTIVGVISTAVGFVGNWLTTTGIPLLQTVVGGLANAFIGWAQTVDWGKMVQDVAAGLGTLIGGVVSWVKTDGGPALVGALKTLATWVITWAGTVDWGGIFKTLISAAVGILMTLGSAALDLLKTIFSPQSLRTIAGALITAASILVGALIDAVRPALEQAGKWVQQNAAQLIFAGLFAAFLVFFAPAAFMALVGPILAAIGVLFTAVGTAVLGLVGLIFSWPVLIALLALAASQIDWKPVIDALTTGFNAVWTFLSTNVIPQATKAASDIWNSISAALASVDWGATAKNVMNKAIDFGTQLIRGVLETLGGKGGEPGLVAQVANWFASVDWGGAALEVLHSAWAIGAQIIQGIMDLIGGKGGEPGLIEKFASWVTSTDWSAVLAGFINIATTIGGTIVRTIGDFLFGRNGEKGLVTLFGDAIVGPNGLMDKIAGLAVEVGRGAAAFGEALAKGIANAFLGVIETMLNAFVTAINSIQIHFGGLETPFGKIAGYDWNGLGIAPVTLPRFEQGGTVPGKRGAPQLIIAEGGETVHPLGDRNDEYGGTFIFNLDGQRIAEVTDKRLRISRGIYIARPSVGFGSSR